MIKSLHQIQLIKVSPSKIKEAIQPQLNLRIRDVSDYPDVPFKDFG